MVSKGILSGQKWAKEKERRDDENVWFEQLE